MSIPPDPVQRIIHSYQQAIHDKDVDAFLNLYAPSVRIFDTWATWSYEGAPAWRATVQQWFGSLGTERVKVVFDNTQILPGQDITVLTAFVTYAAIAEDGQQLRSMQNRLTWALKREAAALKIIHEHTSAPIDLETTKAIFQPPKPKG